MADDARIDELAADLRLTEQVQHAQREEISALAAAGDAMATAQGEMRKAHRAALQQADLLHAKTLRLREQLEALKRNGHV